MPNDAKLGLVAGVAVVVLIAATFFRRDAHSEPSVPDAPSLKNWSPSLPPPPMQPPAEDNSPLPPPPMLTGGSRIGPLHV